MANDITPCFSGEVQMRRWSDSSTQGVQITFALPDSEALEPLKHKAGKRFMAVLVEIGDDELPVEPLPPAARKDTRGPLCREACDLCANPMFQQWLPWHLKSPQGSVFNERACRGWVLQVCEVESRKELDTHFGADAKFIGLVRTPFLRWMRERRTEGATA